MDIQYGGLIGLYLGLLCGVISWYFGRKKSEMKNDEVQKHIFLSARSFSWFATITSIYVLFTLYAVGVSFSIPTVLGSIILVQLGSWAVSSFILKAYYNSEKPINVYLITGFFMMIIPTLLFIVISILIRNWFFSLCAIPLAVVGWCFIKYGDKWKSGGM